jgi:hypothetical protein
VKERMKEDGRYKNESLLQHEAFEYYYSLGHDRSFDKVGDKFGFTPRTITEWSRRFGWQERIIQYDIESSQKLKEKTIDAVVQEKANYRKIIKKMVGDIVDALKDGKFKAKNVQDLERLIKLDLLLMGEITDKTEVKQDIGLTREDREAVNSLIDVMSKNLED